MEERAGCNINGGYPDSEGSSPKETEMLHLASSIEVITKVDLDLAYFSEKLVNLHVLLTYLLAQENDLEVIAIGSKFTSDDFVEKALVFNLSSGILDSEVRVLAGFLDTLKAEMIDAQKKLSLCRHYGLHSRMEEKFKGSKESFKQCQYQMSEMNIQSAKLRRTALAFAHDSWKTDIAMEMSEHEPLSNINAKSNKQMAGQQRHVLRMLEKSLARELDLEKTLMESRQNEEELRRKLHYTEQIAFHMEEAGEVVWGRFLEAENYAGALQGISKEILGKLQLVHFNLNSATQRESELKSKLQHCIKWPNIEVTGLQDLNVINQDNSAINAQLSNLRERVKFLEKKLEESDLQLQNANATNEARINQHRDLERRVDLLKETIYMSDIRAESAELRVAEINGTNVELTEELNFLKGSVNDAEKKVGSLENQLREAEVQLQQAKASAESSQEQQNMLYSAIWDMETLIEELQSKVTKAENKTETVDNQCISLSEVNSELTKELGLLRDRMECMETSLDQANKSRLASADEINVRSKLIMDMVVQLAIERERIQMQLNILTTQKNLLAEKLQTTKKDASMLCNYEECKMKEDPIFKNINASCAKSTLESATNSFVKSLQVDKRTRDGSLHSRGARNSNVNGKTERNSKHEGLRTVEARRLNAKYVFVAIFIPLFMSAMYLLNQKHLFFNDL